MVSICIAGYLAVAILALGFSPEFQWLLLVAALASVCFLFVHAKPKPRQLRWSELFKTFLPVAVLWLAFQVTTLIARAIAGWAG